MRLLRQRPSFIFSLAVMCAASATLLNSAYAQGAVAGAGVPTGYTIVMDSSTFPIGSDVKGVATGTDATGPLTKNTDGSVMILKAVIDEAHKTTFKSGDPLGFKISTSANPPLLAGQYTVSVSLNRTDQSLPDP